MQKLLPILLIASFPALLLTARAEGANPKRDAARQRAVAWMKKNSNSGPSSEMVTLTTRQIDEAVSANKNFYVSFGEGLLRGARWPTSPRSTANSSSSP